MSFSSLISRNTWATKEKKIKKLPSHCQCFIWYKGKTKHTLSRNVNKMLQRGTNPTACCILLGTTTADRLSAYLSSTDNQSGSSTPTSVRSAALSTVSVTSNNERERPQQKITWGHGCSGCNGPDSKQLHRLDPCILIACKTQGELSGMSHEAFYQPEFRWAWEKK